MRNLVLTGYMGTGKTTVGRLLAQRYGLTFVDIDQEVERRAGSTIAEFWAGHAEPAFRELEAEVFAGVMRGSGRVVATGGGTMVAERNRLLLQPDDAVLCLTCRTDRLLDRLGDLSSRPHLAGKTQREAADYVRRHLEERSPVYGLFDQIDTTDLSPAQVAGEIGRRLHLEAAARLEVESCRVSEVLFACRLIERAGEALRQHGLDGEVMLVTDETLVELGHASHLAGSLSDAGLTVHQCALPPGEEHKTLDTLQRLYRACMERRLDRGAIVVGLGGGVIGDLAGMLAATYLRGRRLVLVPTTLLAQADAAVGGKVGVDLAGAKNLIGAFYPAQLVLIDPELLRTLPTCRLSDGLAEVVKSGAILAADLLAAVEELSAARDVLERPDLVRRTVAEKARVVQDDPYERGIRALLNFGHTIGHGLEAASGYGMSHGQAVGVGMVAETWLAERNGWCQAGLYERLATLLARLGLPLRAPGLDPSAVMIFIFQDKKRRRGRVRFALATAPGEGELFEVTDDDVRAAVSLAIEGAA